MIRSVDLFSHRLSMEHGVTVPQLVCLARIVEQAPLTSKALAALVHLSGSTVAGILDRLESKALIHRQRSAEDRRCVWLTPTEAGCALLERSPSPLQDRLSEALATLPLERRAAIATAFEQVVDLLEIGKVDASPILGAGVTLEPSALENIS